MPVFMGGTSCSSQELVKPTTNQSVNKKQKRKKIRHRKKEDDIDEEYLRFFEEGLLFRKNYGSIDLIIILSFLNQSSQLCCIILIENKVVESEKSKLNKESIQGLYLLFILFLNYWQYVICFVFIRRLIYWKRHVYESRARKRIEILVRKSMAKDSLYGDRLANHT
jgi:hypothetical protein